MDDYDDWFNFEEDMGIPSEAVSTAPPDILD